MRYADYKIDDLLSSVTSKLDWLKLLNFTLSEPQFFTQINRTEVLIWLWQSKELFC